MVTILEPIVLILSICLLVYIDTLQPAPKRKEKGKHT